MKRILVCGSNGLLGQRIALRLGGRTDIEVLHTGRQRSFVYDSRLFDYTQLDLTHRGDVRSLVQSFQPTVIVNTVAAVDVDWCEEHRAEAWQTNVVSVEHLVEAARKTDARLIHLSTDYVFDGRNGPYDESALPSPVNYYGKTKLAAENVIRAAGIPATVLRVSLLFGSGISVKGNFALKVVRSLRAGTIVRAPREMGCNPTHVEDAAAGVLAAVERDTVGLYHVSGEEFADRYSFACILADAIGASRDLIERVEVADLHLPAARPASTGFIITKAGQELGLRPMSLGRSVALFRRELTQTMLN